MSIAIATADATTSMIFMTVFVVAAFFCAVLPPLGVFNTHLSLLWPLMIMATTDVDTDGNGDFTNFLSHSDHR